MRQIGSVNSEADAQRFGQFLLTQGIEARIDAADEQWEVWVYDENQIDKAKEAFQRFQEQPQAEEFQAAAREAEKLRKQREKELAAAIKAHKKSRPAKRPTQPTDVPITLLLIIASVVTTLTMGMEDNQFGGIIGDFSITEFRQVDLDRIGYMPGLPEIKQGQVWRLVTPIFLHFGVLHILFNSIMLYQFGFILESILKSWRFLLLVLAIAIPSNLAQYYWGGPSFGGMSGVVFGLFGFMWIKGVYEPESGLQLRRDFVYFMIGFMVLCYTGIFGGIANAAHTVGLLAGCAVAGIRPLLRSVQR
ncbi:MAG: rhomboid family intramembrane serine protease [Rubinisphaera brasiliensis]|uniref:rhomboid family intramembrane serine protease n=1 Tax=Rubinisphaera brasiliensis TaxID=119 RepID=UPI00391C3327